MGVHTNRNQNWLGYLYIPAQALPQGYRCYNGGMADEHSDREFADDDPRDPSYTPSVGADGDNPDKLWVTEDDIKALATERDVFGEDEVLQAERILKENLPNAVHSLAKLARVASSETVRMNAAKYIVDRNLGKITEPQTDEDDALKEMLEGVTVQS